MKNTRFLVPLIIIIILSIGYFYFKDKKEVIVLPEKQETYVRPTPDEQEVIPCYKEGVQIECTETKD